MAPAVPSSSSTCSTSRNLISRSTQRESSVDRRAATGRPTVDRSPVDMPAVARIRHHDLDPTVGARGSTARYLPVPPGITRPTGAGRGTTCPGRGRALGAGVPRGLRRWQGHGQGDPAMADNLVTDLYEATMAASYVRRGMTGPATFSLFTRRLPEQRGFLVAAGLADAVDRLLSFRTHRSRRDRAGRPARLPPLAVRPAAGNTLHRRPLGGARGSRRARRRTPAGGHRAAAGGPVRGDAGPQRGLLPNAARKQGSTLRARRRGSAGGGLLAAPGARRGGRAACGAGRGDRGVRRHEQRGRGAAVRA